MNQPAADEATAVNSGRHARGSHTREGVEHHSSRLGHRQHQTLDQAYGELARVISLLDVVALHLRDAPNILGVLALRVAGWLAHVRSLEGFFPGYFAGTRTASRWKT